MHKLRITLNGQSLEVEVERAEPGEPLLIMHVQGERLEIIDPHPGAPLNRMEWLIIGDRPYEILFDPELRWIQSQGRTYRVNVRDLEAAHARPRSGDGRIKAPIPGQITRVLVEPGQPVAPGGALLILEAMKMENHILAPVGGVLSSVHVVAGQRVMLNELLAEIIPE